MGILNKINVNATDVALKDGIFDISEYNNGASYASLSAALAAVPSSVSTKGGVSVKFKDSTTSRYEQYRLRSTTWSDTSSNWEYIISDGIYDISAMNGGAYYATLDAALTVIPTNHRKGGMTVRFIQGSTQSADNEYVQYRCTADEFTTDVTKWVGEEIKVKNSNIDLSISDKNQYDIVQFANGHIKTKNFDSSQKATDSLDGLMSKEDKQKLDDIENGAEKNNIPVETTNPDFEISDDNNYAIFRIRKGHIKTKEFDSEQIEERIEVLEAVDNRKIVLTIGDSLTEGAGSNKNYKGETVSNPKNYTSWMQTKTNQYIFSVHGIGGENSAAILGRMYGAPFIIGEKFVLPTDTSLVQISLKSSWFDKTTETNRGHNLGGASGTVRDTNPCSINGIPVTLSLSNGVYYINRNTAGSSPLDILAGTPIITNNYSTYEKTSRVLIFWCGTNDGVSVNFTEELISHIHKTCKKYNTEKFVVIGIHHITNDITLANRQRQELQFQDAFREKFINWREYVSTVGIRDAIDRGYIEDSGVYPTSADIAAMNEGKVPPTLLVDTVHLCQEGYYLVGDLVYDRLVKLGYINE